MAAAVSAGKRIVRSLAEKLAMLPDAAKPTKKVEGNVTKWLRPKFSLRQLADMKKDAARYDVSKIYSRNVFL